MSVPDRGDRESEGVVDSVTWPSRLKLLGCRAASSNATMKTLHQIGRHEAEVLDKTGKRIDYAFGRENVWRMRERHGLTPKPTERNSDGCDNLPTGFENE